MGYNPNWTGHLTQFEGRWPTLKVLSVSRFDCTSVWGLGCRKGSLHFITSVGKTMERFHVSDEEEWSPSPYTDKPFFCPSRIIGHPVQLITTSVILFQFIVPLQMVRKTECYLYLTELFYFFINWSIDNSLLHSDDVLNRVWEVQSVAGGKHTRTQTFTFTYSPDPVL